jgi:hypothetical protein
MKNLIIIILSALLFTSCTKKETPEEKKITGAVDTSSVLKTVKDETPPKEVSLSYILKKGQQYTYRLTSISSSTQTIISDSTIQQNLKQTINYLFQFIVNDVEADKIMDLNVNLQSVKLDATINGKKISYQSGSKMDSVDRIKFIEYESVVNNPFDIRIDPKGNIVEIYKVDKIVLKFLTMQGLNDSVNAEQKKQFKENISETALKPLMAQIFRVLPKNNVGKDSLWTNTYTNQIGVFDVTNIAKYKLTGFEKLDNERLAVIDAGLDIKSKGKEKATEKGINYEFKKPVATGSGTIYFNLNKGCIEKSKTTTTLKMSLNMNMPKSPRGPMKATRSDYIENTNILELL